MAKLIRFGRYRLIETRHQNKILYLGRSVYAWVQPVEFGEMLVTTHKPHKTDCVLSIGLYRLYDNSDVHEVPTVQHLELEVGKDEWQGYILPGGLPRAGRPRARIVPTPQLVGARPRPTNAAGKVQL
ncbi:MAG TPA: hypothetical protein VFH39_01665 [Candidatus Saccharimonadales bacterium]|nr:hypothetical protein [Candidatus Saccharimonadales bacterium]